MARRSTYLWFGARVLLAVLVCLLWQTAGHWSRHLWPSLEFSPGSANAQGLDNTLLHPGEVVKRSLEGGGAHTYLLDLEAGKYAHLTVEQWAIESDITLTDPQGQTILRVNSRHREFTPVSLIAKASGSYRLTNSSHEPKGTSGEYQLKFVEARQASRQDEHRIAAETSFAMAEELRKTGDEASNRKAIGLFEQAISSWKEAKDPIEEAHTLTRLGGIYVAFNDVKQALTYYQQALRQYQRSRDPRGECATLNQITAIYANIGKVRAARDSCASATRLARGLGDRTLEAQALNNMGEIYYLLGKMAQATDLYRRGLQLWIETGDRQGQAETYTSLGYTASDLGQVKEAFDFYRQALELWQAARDRQGEAVTLTAMGRLHSRVGESQDALDLFNRAMPVVERSGNLVEHARILTGIAFVYARIGENEKAIDYYERALSLFEKANYPNGQAATLYSAAKVYYESNQHQKALDAQQKALEIAHSIGDHRLEMIVLLEIGKLLDAAGDKSAAIRNYLLARSFAHSQKDLRAEMDAWNLLGLNYKTQDKKPLALDCFRKALALSREAEYRFGESVTLYHIARTQFELGELADARAQTKAAIDVIEALRTKFGSYDLRASYFASVRQLYDLYIDVLMELHTRHPHDGFDVLAFEASERARARSLLEMLGSARVGVREKVDPQLLARERELRQQLNEKAEQKLRLQSVSASEASVGVDREIEELTRQYQEVRAQVRAASLEHTPQAQPLPLDLQEIRERDLKDDTALLEFSLGERQSYLWFVTKDSFKTLLLPARKEIEDSAIQLRPYLMPPAAAAGESFGDFQARVRAEEAEYWRKAELLSNTLLGQIAADLGTRRLLIVPDGGLQYLPFSALSVPLRGGAVTPLMVEHEISFQPSASILGALRNRASRAPAKAIAVFADPVFEIDDSRLAAGRKDMIAAVQIQEGQMESALRDVNPSWSTGKIPRLLASGDEANAIIQVASVSDNLKAIGFDASKAAATSLDLSQYRIIHIATHGVLDSKRPELSGLLLSRFDREGRQTEGFLTLDDIYNLNLAADMVVLSACNTGLGKDVRGEGLVGLVHGFMYAGTSRVVASLWKVDDEATAELMVDFYREMFQGGKSPSAALRAAQIAMWQQKRWHAPYYWAAFVLQGDYEGKLAANRGWHSPNAWQAAVVLILVAVTGFFFWRKKSSKKRHVH
jgi:CHAT domain-containing protein/Tfp pilus assembly protein PilF